MDDYKTYLTEISLDLRTRFIAGDKPPLADIVALLTLDADNRPIRDLCVELKLGSKSEFNAEVRRARQREALGVAPANATQLMKAFAERHKLVARYDGTLRREVRAFHVCSLTGVETPITQADRDTVADVDLYATFHCDARARMTRTDLEAELRILSTNYQMGFAAQDITDAVKAWLMNAQRGRLHDIYVSIAHSESGFDADTAWRELAERVFDCSETSPAFVAAVLRKFMWQVKRKLRGMQVTDHLMPVILGPQGVGKSTFVNAMVGPVEELRLNVDFQMVTDERNVDIWRSYVMFLDEMGFASKSDIDSVKNIITASTLTRRPMRSNDKDTIDQNATFIGCSNKELAQLIRDPTGIRRFVAIRMRSNADRTFINAIDWRELWGSVDVAGADPMAVHRSTLGDQQEETRERGRVEQWMLDFNGATLAYQSKITRSGLISTQDLYYAFREYEESDYPGFRKTDKTEWDHEMKRLRMNQPECLIFERKRSASGWMYRWNQEPNLRAVK